jgi:hypothetical protein
MTSSPTPQIVAAPWQLQGRGAVIPIWQTSKRRMGLLIVADYQHSNAGPYQELLWIEDLRRGVVDGHPTISKIYVSTQISVDSGHANWGIPKQLGQFKLDQHDQQLTLALRTPDDAFVASLCMRAYGPAFRVNSRWLPKQWLTLVQDWDDKRFRFTPHARGMARLARVPVWALDAVHFAQANGRVLGALMIDDFQMSFPVADIRPISPTDHSIG